MKFAPQRSFANAMCLFPYDEAAREFMAALPNAEPIQLEVIHDRDMHEHRRIFAQINELAKEIGTDPAILRAELLMETGNFVRLGELFGETIVAVNSMSKNAMTDHELLAFWEEAKEVITHKMLPRVKDTARRQQLWRSLSQRT